MFACFPVEEKIIMIYQIHHKAKDLSLFKSQLEEEIYL